jgi:hypothetical protein
MRQDPVPVPFGTSPTLGIFEKMLYLFTFSTVHAIYMLSENNFKSCFIPIMKVQNTTYKTFAIFFTQPGFRIGSGFLEWLEGWIRSGINLV